MPTKPSIVFCHGIWADGSSFSKVIPPLQVEGYPSDLSTAATSRCCLNPASWST